MKAYIGTYTGGKSRGIYLIDFNGKAGKISILECIKEKNPSYIAIDEKHNVLFCVNEVLSEKIKNGAAASYKIDKETGNLKFISRTILPGKKAPCHISYWEKENILLCANYNDGTVNTILVDNKGRLDNSIFTLQNKGSGPVIDRQEAAHTHCIFPVENTNIVLAADLGADKVFIYRLKGNKLISNDIPYKKVHLGAGPRHIAFHPDNAYAYLINEIDSTICTFKICKETGQINIIQTVSALPKEFSGISYSSAVKVSKDGKFVYASNRGHDSISVFKINPEDKTLINTGFINTLGKWPRDFELSPDGKYLFALNQNTDDIYVFKINKNGITEYTGSSINIPSPVCIKFLT